MNAIELAVSFVKDYEGFSPTPYLCPADYWTIGYGHLCNKDHPSITKEEAVTYLMEDMSTALKAVQRYCPNIMDDTSKVAALTSWTFNLGSGSLASSTMRKRILEGDIEAAAREMRRWNKATVNGKKIVLRGLTRRRETEAHLFLTGEIIIPD